MQVNNVNSQRRGTTGEVAEWRPTGIRDVYSSLLQRYLRVKIQERVTYETL